MKGFKNSTRMRSGHSFSTRDGFSGSAGVRMVKGYTRKAPKFAEGGRVEKGTDGGHALTQRANPVTDLDKARGGTSPLAPGFAKGGQSCKSEVKSAINKHISSPKPRGHGVGSFSKKPMIGR